MTKTVVLAHGVLKGSWLTHRLACGEFTELTNCCTGAHWHWRAADCLRPWSQVFSASALHRLRFSSCKVKATGLHFDFELCHLRVNVKSIKGSHFDFEFWHFKVNVEPIKGLHFDFEFCHLKVNFKSNLLNKNKVWTFQLMSLTNEVDSRNHSDRFWSGSFKLRLVLGFDFECSAQKSWVWMSVSSMLKFPICAQKSA